MNLVIRSLSEQAYEMIRMRILVGEIAPGMALRQDAIALQLGVSKIPLREALTRLAQDGLLSSKPNRGFVVRALSAEEAEEVFALRLKLEPEAAAKACRVATQEDRARVLVALAELEDQQQVDFASLDATRRNLSFQMSLVAPGAGW
ncbi:MAG: GntR family transcriptional regulator [Caulobacteraceae bacterium]